MRPKSWRVSADEAIEHFGRKGYSYTKEKLPDFDAYDSGLVHESRELELKALYDAALTKIIEGSVEFAVYERKTKEYRVVALSRDEFERWLVSWQYDDDLVVLSQNKAISVFHHSGFVFGFKSSNKLLL